MSQLFYLFGSNIGILLIRLDDLFNSQPENSNKKSRSIKIGFELLFSKTIIMVENNIDGMPTASQMKPQKNKRYFVIDNIVQNFKDKKAYAS